MSQDSAPDVTSDLPDLGDTPLGDIADAVKDGDAAPEDTLRRVAPGDGTQLLVAASFNSAI